MGLLTKVRALMCLKIVEFVESAAIDGVGIAGHTGILVGLATTLEFKTR
jgi:hypothetical protein